MSELGNCRSTWPIPADRNPLSSEHLRKLALHAVATAAAGVSRLGWGLALPPAESTGARPEGRPNETSLSGGMVHVTGLSVVLPEGVYVTLDRASVPLPDRGGGVVGLVYTLPAHAEAVDRPAPVEPSLDWFTDTKAATTAGATALAEVRSTGRGQRRSLHWLAPALEIGAAPESATAAAALSEAMLAAAMAAGTRQGYEWQAVAAALRLAAAQPAETPPPLFNREIARAVGGVVALARGAPSSVDSGALKAVTALATDLDAPPPTGAEPEALAKWFKALAEQFKASGPLIAWLHGTGAERLRLPGYPRANDIGRRLDRFDVADAECVEIRLRLRDRVAPMVRARVDDAPFALLALTNVPGGFAGVLRLPANAQHVDFDLPAEVEVAVREMVGGAEDRS